MQRPGVENDENDPNPAKRRTPANTPVGTPRAQIRKRSEPKMVPCKYTLVQLQKRSVVELKAMLQSQNLKTSGNKPELAMRVLSNPEKFPVTFRTPAVETAKKNRSQSRHR